MSILLQPLKYKRLATYLEIDEKNVDLVRPFVKRLIENRIFGEDVKWFRHGLVKKCFEDDLDDEERITYHERAAKFFESLIEAEKQRWKQREQRGELNIQYNDSTSIEENYSTGISCAYHVHMAGDHEKSFTYNRILAGYASKIGDLDIAERCYIRAIADAKYLKRLQDEMDCLSNLTVNVYSVWGRYEEALSNFQSLLKYYDSISDPGKRELRSTPPIATADFLYLRFIGDRSIQEKDFGKIQKDRVMEMKKWSSKVKRTIKEERRGRRKSINLAIVSANNHYAGFGPGTANIFRKMVGLAEATWSKKEDDKSHLHSSSSYIQHS